MCASGISAEFQMSNASLQLTAYCALVVLASLVGGWVPLLARLTHRWTQLLMSFVAGLMLGVGALHMLVHSAVEIGLDQAVLWMLFGLVAMFFLQRFFHFHHHGPGDVLPVTVPSAAECLGEHGHSHPGHHHGPVETFGHPLSWIGLALGLTVHTLLDGVALASSVEIEAGVGGGGMYGLGTFLAVILHKPLDSMALAMLLAAGRWSVGVRHAVNAGFALIAPLGAALFYLGVQRFASGQHAVIGCALAFSAGTFLCISLSDLLPEIQFHSHDRIKLSAAMLLGIAAAYGIGFFESSGHEHHHHPNHNSAGEHPGHGHQHH
jgi:zinc and cadmium transporter